MKTSSTEVVANIEELLTKILVSVPPHSIARFKCVSKHWLSVISSIQNPKISAFFSSITEEESFKSIPLGNHEIPPGWNPFLTLNNSVPDGSKLRIIQSCNGLFLCHIPLFGKQAKYYRPVYVVNPTTNQFRVLSTPRVGENDSFFEKFVRYALAFDPSKSPHYKLICVSNFPFYHDGGKHDIDIYSSETGEWKHLDTPFFPSPSDEGSHPDFIQNAMHFDHRCKEGAIYCNGIVHWIRKRREAEYPLSFRDGRIEFVRNEIDVMHYFDIGEERLGLVAAPVPFVVKKMLSKVRNRLPRYINEWPSLAQRFLGEYHGHLYLIETYKHCITQFEVMEMERDYSGWFVKYNVDLSPVFAALPRQDGNAFVVLCLSLEETDDEVKDISTVLLLKIPGKVISYNLKNKTFKTSVELANKQFFSSSDIYREEDDNYAYVKSQACV